MATKSFKDRYAGLFGETTSNAPSGIDVPDALAAPERAARIADAAPTIDAGGSFKPSALAPVAPPPPEQGIGGNLVDLTKTGTALGAEAVVGLGEYAARQLGGDSGTTRNEIASDLVGAGESVRSRLTAYRQSIYETMSPQVMAQRGAEFLTLDPDKTIWKGGPGQVAESVLYKFWESVPMMAGTIIPAAVMMRAGAPGAVQYLGASEAGLSVGFIQNEIADGINAMDDETLAEESPRFAELVQSGMQPDTARQQTIQEGQSLAPAIGGALVGAISYGAGRYLEPVIMESAAGAARIGLGQRAARGAVSEGLLQEGPQESVEQIMQNYAARIYDGDRSVMEGVPESFVQGTVVGAPGGAGVAVLAGGGQEDALTSPDTPEEPGQPTPIADKFEEVFTEQAPPEGGYTGAPPTDLFGDQTPSIDSEFTADIDPAVSAAIAANIREDNLMGDIVDNIESQTPEFQAQGNLDLQGGQTAPPPAPPSGGTNFQLVQPSFEDVMGPNGPPVSPPPPPGPPGVAPTGQQGDLFGQPQNLPDEPTAEPLADVQAQLQDMADETTDREGVYLSAANVVRLQRDGLMDQLTGSFVPVENFDGKGGLLLAKDAEVAQGARDMLELGIPMQSVLGQLTSAALPADLIPGATGTAGSLQDLSKLVKPVGDTVVQLRDAEGNVVRETLASEDQAYALADRLGDNAVVLTSDAALRRREQLIASEQPGVEQTRESRRQQDILREELPIEERAPLEKFAGSQTRKPASRAAAGVIGDAARQASEERSRAIGGFFPPNTLEFANPALETQYAEAFSKLLDNQLEQETAGTYPINRPADLKKAQTKLFRTLGKIRQVAKPKRKVAKKLRIAAKIDRPTTATAQRDLSKKSTVDDGSQKDYLHGELREMSRAEVGALRGTALAEAFADAAYWLAGQWRNIKISPEWKIDNPNATDQEIASELHKESGDSLALLAAKWSTPGQQRVLILRAVAALKRRKDGGKAKARPVVIKGTKTDVDTGALTRDTTKQDESRQDEIKRKTESSTVRKKLQTAVRQSGKLILRMENQRSTFGEILAERDPDTGAVSAAASELSVARAYFVALNQFANSLIASELQTTEINTVMSEVDKQLRVIAKLPPKKFGAQVARMAHADERAGLRTIANKAVREQVTNPKRRLATILEYRKKLVSIVASRARMENVWKKNAYYNNLVGPLMQKFSDSIATDGWASYRPTEAEMGYLEHAMNGWRTGGEHTRKNFYSPMKKFFRGVGMTFAKEKTKGAGGDLVIPMKNGKYQWSSNFKALEKQLRTVIGNETEGSFFRRDKSLAEVNAEIAARGEANRRIQSGETAADLAQDREQANLIINANRAINAFRKIVANPKSTIQKLVKAEQALIKRMKALNLWKDTPSKAFGKITLGTVRNYRHIGLPLLQKKLTKQEARAVMSKLQPFPMPEGLGQQTFTATQAEKELHLTMAVVNAPANQAEFQATASAIGDLLVDRHANVGMNQVLDAMLANLPERHVYRTLATKLRALDLNIPVRFDYGGKLGNKALGQFTSVTDKFGTSRVVILNNRKMIKDRGDGNAIESQVIHVLLHEMTHAATHQALRNNPGLKRTILALREEALLQWGGGKRPYGLKTIVRDGEQIADEFIAEAFSNLEFQNRLKGMYLGGKSLWQRLLLIVRDVLGLPNNTPVAIMDVIMSLEAQLFADAGTNAAEDITLNMDGAVRPVISNMIDQLNKTTGTLDRIWNKVTNAPLIAMTMEQIRDTYSKVFGGSAGPLRQYMDAFFQRNALNTQLMEDAEKLTRRWTALDELNGEVGQSFSVLATDATLNEIAADKPLGDKANEHLKSLQQKARHKEMHARFNALPEGYKKLYGDLQGYYRSTLDREVSLMQLNALRGLLTKGDQSMSKKAFEAKYTLETLSKLDSKEKFTAEFGDLLDKEMMSTLHQMSTIRQKRKGNYFPLKRYGDFVVAAENQIERKRFTDRKEAFGYAAERRATDVTLTVDVIAGEVGDFVVRVTEKDFRTAETPTRAAEMRREMVKLYGEDKVSMVQKKSVRSVDAVISSNQALGSILQSLAGNIAAQAAIKNFYLEALSDSSFRKHEMRRKNRRGVDTDLQLRNFTVYAKQSAYYTSQLQFGHKMADGIAEMDKFVRAHRDTDDITALRLGEIREEIIKRDQMTADPDQISKLVKGSVELTQFMMLTSPSYWMINASQPWMVTLPWLAAKYGTSRSLAAMKNAQSLIISPLVRATVDSKGGLSALRSKIKAESAFNVLDDVIEQIKVRDPGNAKNYISMLEELKQNNVIDLSWIAELRDISEGADTGMKQKVLDASRVMAHLTEVNNRILTAISTYDLASNKAREMDLPPAEQHAFAVDQAQKSVSETQFNYSSPNKPRLFQAGGPLGKFGPAVFQFMQWPQHMYALMIKSMHQSVKGGTDAERREARRLLTGLFSTHLAAAGVLGAALQPVKWAFGLLMMAFGDDDDTLKNAISGATFDRDVTRAFASLFGSEIGGVLAKGLPTAVGADLSQRMSLGTVYYLDFKGNNAESALGSLVLGFGGASVNLASNMWRGANDFIAGDYVRGIERASPKILRDVIRTGRYWKEGLVNNAGDTVISAEGVSPRDLLLQALGIQPFVVSQFYQGQQAIKDKERFYRDRKSDILKAFRTAAPRDIAGVLRDVAAFNRNNPAIAITRSALLQSRSAKAKRESRFRRYGANIDERAASQFAEAGLPYR